MSIYRVVDIDGIHRPALLLAEDRYDAIEKYETKNRIVGIVELKVSCLGIFFEEE